MIICFTIEIAFNLSRHGGLFLFMSSAIFSYYLYALSLNKLLSRFDFVIYDYDL